MFDVNNEKKNKKEIMDVIPRRLKIAVGISNNKELMNKESLFTRAACLLRLPRRILRMLLAMTFPVLALALVLSLGIISESQAETTCTWQGTKLIVGGSGTFSGCDSIYDDDDNEIDWWEQQEKITEIEFGDDVTALGDYAFENVPNLTSLNTNNITSIGDQCFENSQSLTTVVMPNVTDIGSCAFCGASSLTSVLMPKVENLGDNNFEDTGNLKTIEIPDTLVFADGDAFQTASDVVLIISDKIDMSGWDGDALNDDGDGTVTFKCKGDQDVCKAKIQEFAARASFISGYNLIFDAGDHKECFSTSDDDDENVSYYHSGSECVEYDDDEGIICASGYADYNGNCYAQLPFAKKRWTPAEANEWLHDGNDNFVIITFKH